MSRIRFLMLGGFLGAGKTTTISSLARHYVAQGKRVAIVTNDQAYNLVDTEMLRAQGFNVGEVPGACFCCKFNDLLETTSRLTRETMPEIVITEPVGSCTDLVATVVEPLRHLHGDEYEVAPLAVLLKPEHGQKILRGEANVGFSPKAAYIFLKQLEEADLIVINKVDKLSQEERQELFQLLQQRFPQKPLMAMSARTGEGIVDLAEALENESRQHLEFMQVDYDTYAEGEAELGWLNCQLKAGNLESPAFALDELVLKLVGSLRDILARNNAEPAHLKVLGQAGQNTAIANLVGSDLQAELSIRSQFRTLTAECIVNARVAQDPAELEAYVDEAVRQVSAEIRVPLKISGMQRFRPGRPTPTHRLGV